MPQIRVIISEFCDNFLPRLFVFDSNLSAYYPISWSLRIKIIIQTLPKGPEMLGCSAKW